MNKLKFNEEKENKGVVRKRIADAINRRKLSLIGILTGIMFIMTISFTTTANVFGPTAGVEAEQEEIIIGELTTASILTAGTSLAKPTTTGETTVSTTTSLTTSTTEETTESTTTTNLTTTLMESTTTTATVETTVQVNVENDVIEVDTYNDIPEETSEYIVYKPSSHYVHKNTCRWFNNECYEINSTEGIECKRCSECNPDIEIVTPYVEPAPQTPAATASGSALDYITELEYIYLCNTVGHEYGSDIVSIYDKACVVATVMNRVRDGGWTNGLPSTIYNVLTAPYQFNPSYATGYYHSCVTQSCKDAVNYYFAHQNEFPHYTSFWGDGRYNHFS
jgi:hypothetical protein